MPFSLGDEVESSRNHLKYTWLAIFKSKFPVIILKFLPIKLWQKRWTTACYYVSVFYSPKSVVLWLTTAELMHEYETDSFGKFHENIQILLQRIRNICIIRKLLPEPYSPPLLMFWSNFVNLNEIIALELIYSVQTMSWFSWFSGGHCIGFLHLRSLLEIKLLTVQRSSNQILTGWRLFSPVSWTSAKLMAEEDITRLGVMYSSCLIFAIWAFNLLSCHCVGGWEAV